MAAPHPCQFGTALEADVFSVNYAGGRVKDVTVPGAERYVRVNRQMEAFVMRVLQAASSVVKSRAELTPRGAFLRIAAMKIIPVLCQRCGAPLDVADESVRFVTCAHCSTPLEIVREATQSHSRILEQIQKTAEEHGQRLEIIELQNDIERLDRDWEAKQRDEGNVNAKTGAVEEDGSIGCFALGLLVTGGGVIGAFGAFGGSSFSFGTFLACLAMIAVGVFIIREGIAELSRFDQAKDRYRAIRASLVNRINLLRRK